MIRCGRPYMVVWTDRHYTHEADLRTNSRGRQRPRVVTEDVSSVSYDAGHVVAKLRVVKGRFKVDESDRKGKVVKAWRQGVYEMSVVSRRAVHRSVWDAVEIIIVSRWP